MLGPGKEGARWGLTLFPGDADMTPSYDGETKTSVS